MDSDEEDTQLPTSSWLSRQSVSPRKQQPQDVYLSEHALADAFIDIDPCRWAVGDACRVPQKHANDLANGIVEAVFLNQTRTAWVADVLVDGELVSIQAHRLEDRVWHSTQRSSASSHLFEDSQALDYSDQSLQAQSTQASSKSSQPSPGGRIRTRPVFFNTVDELAVDAEEERFKRLERLYKENEPVEEVKKTRKRRRVVSSDKSPPQKPMIAAKSAVPSPAPSLQREDTLDTAIRRAAHRTVAETEETLEGGPSPRQRQCGKDRPPNLEHRPSFDVPESSPCEPHILEPATEEHAAVAIPAYINRYLRQYQRDGVEFLYSRFKENGGALLGDDMGLGKTVQVIAFLAAVLGKTGETGIDVQDPYERKLNESRSDRKRRKIVSNQGPVLIVMPLAVLYNWEKELNTWGHFRVGIFHGSSQSHKAQVLKEAKQGKIEVVLTVYETIRNNIEAFLGIPWHMMICDEAHKLKTRKSELTKTFNRFHKVRRRFALTGTAVQNKISEFWCLLDWTNPGYLGTSSEFRTNYEKPILGGQRSSATPQELAACRSKSSKLQKAIRPIFLRRTKDLIKDQLPSKQDLVVFCPVGLKFDLELSSHQLQLTELQSEVYSLLLQSADFELVTLAKEPCPCKSGKVRSKCCFMYSRYHKEGKTCKCGTKRMCMVCHCSKPIDPTKPGCMLWKDMILQNLTLLQKVSNHLGLLLPNPSDPEIKRKKDRERCAIAFAGNEDYLRIERSNSFVTLSRPDACGKMKVLRQMLPIWKASGSKVLLFSYSVRLLDMIEMAIVSEGESYLRLDGRTKGERRLEMAHEFNTDKSILLFLISTRAGGVGLNLTGANVVVVFDPNWNPSHDLQAQDRAFRIGQSRDVTVYRLIAAGSLEEVVYARQIYKQQVANISQSNSKERRYFDGVQGDPTRTGELFGLQNLFTLSKPGAKTQSLIEKTKLAEADCYAAKFNLKVDGGTVLEDTPEDRVDEFELSCVVGEELEHDAETPRKRRMAKQLQDVQTIFQATGVEFTHENAEVVGESVAEKRLSRKAQRMVRAGAISNQPVNNYLSDSDMDLDTQDDARTSPKVKRRAAPKRRRKAPSETDVVDPPRQPKYTPHTTRQALDSEAVPQIPQPTFSLTPDDTPSSRYTASTIKSTISSGRFPSVKATLSTKNSVREGARRRVDLMDQHFAKMSSWFGCPSIEGFAQAVMAMSDKERDDLTDRFYCELGPASTWK